MLVSKQVNKQASEKLIQTTECFLIEYLKSKTKINHNSQSEDRKYL